MFDLLRLLEELHSYGFEEITELLNYKCLLFLTVLISSSKDRHSFTPCYAAGSSVNYSSEKIQ